MEEEGEDKEQVNHPHGALVLGTIPGYLVRYQQDTVPGSGVSALYPVPAPLGKFGNPQCEAPDQDHETK